MLVTTERLYAKSGREAELAERLEALAQAVRGEAGCREVRLARSLHEGGVFVMLARYEGESALDEHVRAEHYTEALPALMDCLEVPPEVAIFEEIAEPA